LTHPRKWHRRPGKRASGAKAKGLQRELGAFFLRNRTTDVVHLLKCRQAAQPWAGSNELFPRYITATVAVTAAIPASLAAGCGRNDRNQPAESHARGITNSDQPQSRQT
jgi:hypothetical protein